MARPVLVSLLRGQSKPHWLDTETGRVAPAEPGTTRGVAVTLDDATLAVYVDAGTLWLQWNGQRWPFMDAALSVRYGHDVASKTTTFAVDQRSITYEAWWSTDPVFNPMAPELDEYWDQLAYFYALKQEPLRMRELLERWSAPA